MRRIHLTAGRGRAVAQRRKRPRLILTHFHDRAGAEALIGAAAKEDRGTTVLAEPGMRLDIG